MRQTIVVLLAIAALVIAAGASAAPPPSMNFGGEGGGSVYYPGDPLSPEGYYSTLTITGDTADMGKSCGHRTVRPHIRWDSATWPVQVKLWVYQMTLTWTWCNYKVTSVTALYDEPTYSCCNWSWDGNIVKTHSPVGGASMTATTKGHFHACALWVIFCKDRYPTITIRVNGNGYVTDGSWDA